MAEKLRVGYILYHPLNYNVVDSEPRALFSITS